jgi:hypothetical protein
VSFGGEGQARRGLPSWGFPLLVLLDVLLLAVLATAAVLLWSFVGGSIPGTSVEKDSIDSGSKPRVRLANAVERVHVEG